MLDREPKEGGRAPVQRREALAGALGAAAALGLTACGADEGGKTTPAPNPEAEAMTGLLALERAAITTYEEGARFSGEEQAGLLTRFAGQSVEHVRALDDLILAVGGARPAREVAGRPTFIRDDESARRASRAAGTRLVKAYVAAIPTIASGQARRDLMTMLANDAQHVSLLTGRAKALPGDPAIAAAGATGSDGGIDD